MALVLNEAWIAHTKKSGAETFELAAGNKVRIQKWENGVGITDILSEDDGTVPEGKVWSVNVFVDIHETDA